MAEKVGRREIYPPSPPPVYSILFKLRISYRLVRFPHQSQARRAISAPVPAVLIWLILRFVTDFRQAVKFRVK